MYTSHITKLQKEVPDCSGALLENGARVTRRLLLDARLLRDAARLQLAPTDTGPDYAQTGFDCAVLLAACVAFLRAHVDRPCLPPMAHLPLLYAYFLRPPLVVPFFLLSPVSA